MMTFSHHDYAFFIQLGCNREESKSESSESELSSHIGSDTDFNPTQTSSDEEDFKWLGKALPYDKLSSDEDLKAPDSNWKEDQQKGKNPITYGKTKNKKQKAKKTETVTTVTIKTCTKREDRKRAWDKCHYCLYCGKSNLKIARHLQRKHMEMKDVAYAFSFPLGSKERRVLLEELRNKGDFKHNTRILEKGMRK